MRHFTTHLITLNTLVHYSLFHYPSTQINYNFMHYRQLSNTVQFLTLKYNTGSFITFKIQKH
uniref:Uncharacterized protein n=1 Tax=Anguilla anguilla TaxID=7936 RepID=A0A0E9QP64_ANGAN